jgi:hypothetical protein
MAADGAGRPGKAGRKGFKMGRVRRAMDAMQALRRFLGRKEVKVLILVLIPFIYGYMLPHTQTLRSENLRSPTLTDTENGSVLDFQSVQGTVGLPDGVNSIFPLGKYLSIWPLVSFNDPQLCFEDQGSYVQYTNGTRLPAEIEWDVALDNGSVVHVSQDSVNCSPIEFGRKFSYRWEGKLFFLINRNESLGNVSVVPDASTYHQFEYDYGVLQGLALIPALYLLVWYPLFGIIRKIEKGWKEQ